MRVLILLTAYLLVLYTANAFPQDSHDSDGSVVHPKHLYKNAEQLPITSQGPNLNTGILNSVFNIPVGILRTVQESLTGVQVGQAGVAG